MKINLPLSGTLLSAASVLALMAATPTFAQDAGSSVPAPAAVPDETVVVVTGVRASQKRAVNIKRDAAQVVDAISSEDIGKFPDATISDSLQRIPGVQVRREAGEAGAINIRGLPQVATYLNGEAFLGANSITNVQPNFGDIPSQLMSGAEVFKSATASQLGAGITGTVNLKTWKPFDFHSGLTVSGAVEGAYGSQTEKWEPSANGLVSWRNDKFGVLLSVAASDTTSANSYNGMNGNYGWAGKAGESWAFTQAAYDATTGKVNDGLAFSSGDQNGDGDTDDSYVSYEGWKATNKTTRRQRTGINLATEWRISDGLKLNAEYFHTDQTQWNSEVGLVAESKWSSWGWFKPLETTSVGTADNLYTVQSALYNVQRLSTYTEVNRFDSNSDNFSLTLTYDNGGKLKYKARYLTAKAEQANTNIYIDSTLADQRQWGAGYGYYPGNATAVATAPNGYSGLLPITVNNPGNGKAISLAGLDSSMFANLDNYAVDAISSEGNYDRNADMNIFRFDGNYAFADDVNFDFGYRHLDRSVDNQSYDYLSPLYAAYSSTGTQNLGNGCLVKWKSSDVVLNQASACTAGDGTNYFTALAPTTLASLGSGVYMKISDYGGASGIPSGYGVNPDALKDPYAFINSLYPGTVRWNNPGSSYGVDVKQDMTYLQMNLKGELALPFKANFGVQIINTDLTVQQNIVGDGGQYGAAASDAGDTITKRSFTDVLPSLNIVADVKDNMKLRFGYAKNMTLLDLEQWGGAKSLTYALDTSGEFTVRGGSENGNPNLDPWRSTNYDLSFEWYNAPGSMFSVGAFYIEVASFVTSGSRQSLEQDQTGGGSRVVTLTTPVQGEGGILKGLEFNAKQAFTYLPGIWSNFGVDANYTYSPSTRPGKDLSGDALEFPDNSKHQANLAVWYENGPLQARVAYNYRSRRLVSENLLWSTEGLNLYQAPTQYVDASVSYEFRPNVTAYLQGSNLTAEKETYYMQWENQQAYQNDYERRITLGVRAKF